MRRRSLHVGLISFSLAIGVLMTLPNRATAGAARGWVASVSLSVFSRGAWRSTNDVDSLGLVRVRLVVKGQGIAGPSVAAHVAISHFSWQGFRKVTMAPSVVAGMKRTSASGSVRTFQTVVRIPTRLPAGWSVIDVTATDGPHLARVRTGVFVGEPALQTIGNTVTIPTAARFCSKAPLLHNIPYAVFMHGYYEGVYSNGPPLGITFDRPRRLPAHMGLFVTRYPHGLLTGGNPPDGVAYKGGDWGRGWYTGPGILECDMRRPSTISFS